MKCIFIFYHVEISRQSKLRFRTCKFKKKGVGSPSEETACFFFMLGDEFCRFRLDAFSFRRFDVRWAVLSQILILHDGRPSGYLDKERKDFLIPGVWSGIPDLCLNYFYRMRVILKFWKGLLISLCCLQINRYHNIISFYMYRNLNYSAIILK